MSISLPELQSVQLVVLIENTARGAGVLGEHGLCWLLESGGRVLLFDLGQGIAFHHNAGRLGADWKRAEAVVFSHGHYDHVGGWRVVAPDFLSPPRIVLHPAALDPKFQKRADGTMAGAGDPSFPESLRKSSFRIEANEGPVEVLPGIWSTGEVPRRNDFEDTGGDFYCGVGGCEKDSVRDDLSIFFNTPAGIVVILGCAHAGVINILEHVADLTGGRHVHAVLGGMHLLHASEIRLRSTAEALGRISPDWIAPNHCTGDAAVAFLRSAFPGHVLECHVGHRFRFPPG